jgi:PadR family transcriptional regulator, regulatory protein AphA
MSLDHAILGFLQYRPLSGYDLKAEFDFALQWIWPADQSHIYRTLARLAEKGWIDTQIVKQSSRPDRKVYHITKKGRDELMHWLNLPALNKDVRLAQLVQIFFSGHLSDGQIIKLFEGLADTVRRSLPELQEIPKMVLLHKRNISTTPRDEFLRLITREYLIRSNEAYLALLEDMIARLKRGDHLIENSNEKAHEESKTKRKGLRKRGLKKRETLKNSSEEIKIGMTAAVRSGIG